MKFSQSSGFTLIEILIVITIIGVLAALSAGSLSALGGAKSRDAVRIANLQQLATIVGSLQNRFHVPPLSRNGRKYPSVCREGEDLQSCLSALQVANEHEIYNLLVDPKQGAEIGNKQFQYYYVANTDGFKICAHMEDQGAFENINADEDGLMRNSFDAQDNSAYMHCVSQGKNIEDLPLISISANEPTS